METGCISPEFRDQARLSGLEHQPVPLQRPKGEGRLLLIGEANSLSASEMYV